MVPILICLEIESYFYISSAYFPSTSASSPISSTILFAGDKRNIY